jgi:WD40 repeat protein/serine/threonine protein kinase
MQAPETPDSAEVDRAGPSEEILGLSDWSRRQGDVVAGDLIIEEVIGGGGMGEVIRVYHRGWGIHLAVKTPNATALETSGGRDRFVEREAYEWIRLGAHPNIATCFYVRIMDAIPRIFIEYVEGGTLLQWIRNHLVCEVSQAFDIGIQLSWGLAWAHENRLVHRDINPRNVLLTKSGIPKITDLGLVKPLNIAKDPGEDGCLGESNVLHTTADGTQGYAAPEQKRGYAADTRVDVYAMGITLYQLFSHSLNLPLHTELPPLDWGAAYSSELKSWKHPLSKVLGKCINLSPELRYSNASEVAEALIATYPAVLGSDYDRPAPNAVDIRANGFNNRGVSLIDLERLDEALSAFDKALAADPQHPEATFNAGLLKWRLGQARDEDVVQAMSAIAESYPDWPDARFLLSLVHLERGDITEADHLLRDSTGAVAEAQRVSDEVRALCQQSSSIKPPCIEKPVSVACLSSNGSLLVTGNEREADLWLVTPERCSRTIPLNALELQGLAVSAQGNRIAAVTKHPSTAPKEIRFPSLVRMWDVQTGREVWRFSPPSLALHEIQIITYKGQKESSEGLEVNALALSSDGERIALGVHSNKRGHLILLFGCEAREHLVLQGSEDDILHLAFVPGDRLLASASADGTIRIWTLGVAAPLRVLEGHHGPVNGLAFSADGHRMISVGSDTTLRIWDLATLQAGAAAQVIDAGPEAALSCWLDPGGNLAVSGDSNGCVRVWDLGSGRCRRTFRCDTKKVLFVGCSSDPHLVVCHADSGLKLIRTGGRFFAWPFPRPLDQRYRLARPRLIADLSEDKHAADTAIGRARRALEAGDHTLALRHATEARAVRGWERTPEGLSLWRALQQYCRRSGLRGAWVSQRLQMHERPLHAVRITGDGSRVVSGGESRLKDLPSAQSMDFLRGILRSVESTDAPEDANLYLWSREATGHPNVVDGQVSGATVCSLDFSPDEKSMLVAYAPPVGGWREHRSTLELRDLSHGRKIRDYPISRPLNAVRFSPDGKLALTAESSVSEPSVCLWALEEGRIIRRLIGHPTSINAVDFGPDQTIAVTGGDDRSVRLWDVPGGRCFRVLQGHTDRVTAVCVRPDGQTVLSASEDGTCRLWHIRTGNCLVTMGRGRRPIEALGLTRDGRWAFAGTKRGSILVYDLTAGSEIASFDAHEAPVRSLSVTPDGTWLVSAGEDGRVCWIALDWHLDLPVEEETEPVVLSFLQHFLTLHRPCAHPDSDAYLGLVRSGRSSWTDSDIDRLIAELKCAGLGEPFREWIVTRLHTLADHQNSLAPAQTGSGSWSPSIVSNAATDPFPYGDLDPERKKLALSNRALAPLIGSGLVRLLATSAIRPGSPLVAILAHEYEIPQVEHTVYRALNRLVEAGSVTLLLEGLSGKSRIRSGKEDRSSAEDQALKLLDPAGHEKDPILRELHSLSDPLTGPEVLYALARRRGRLHGAEVPTVIRHQMTSALAFHRTMLRVGSDRRSLSESLAKHTRHLREVMSLIRDTASSAALQKIFHIRCAYERHCKLSVYVTELMAAATESHLDMSPYTHVERLNEVLSLERTIDFQQGEKQRKELLDMLTSGALSNVPSDLKRDIALVMTGNEDAREGLLKNLELMASGDTRFANYERFLRYSRLFETLLAAQPVQQQAAQLFHALCFAAARSEREHETLLLDEELRDLLQMVSLRLPVWRLGRLLLSDLPFTDWMHRAFRLSESLDPAGRGWMNDLVFERCERSLPDACRALDSLVPLGLDVYEAGKARSVAMADNALRIARASRSRTVLLACGRWHIPGIVSRIEQESLASWALFAPTISDGEVTRESVSRWLNDDEELVLPPVVASGRVFRDSHAKERQPSFWRQAGLVARGAQADLHVFPGMPALTRKLSRELTRIKPGARFYLRRNEPDRAPHEVAAYSVHIEDTCIGTYTIRRRGMVLIRSFLCIPPDDDRLGMLGQFQVTRIRPAGLDWLFVLGEALVARLRTFLQRS